MSTELTVSNAKQLGDYLGKSRSAIVNALPGHLKADRMIRLAQTAYSTNPELKKCTPQSILSSLVVAAQVGLEPGVTGQCYLIPYKGTCTMVPGWQGLVGLLNNTGRATAWTGAVYDGDLWEFELGSRPKCRHVPGPNFGDSDKLAWVYACGKVNGSEQEVIEAWPVSRVIKHRDRYNKVGSRHYSYANFEMYARKVVLLQVLKYMPRSIELNNAIVAADAAEIGHTTVVDNGVVIEMETGDAPVTDAPSFQSSPVKTDVPVKSDTLDLPKKVRALLAAEKPAITVEAFLSWWRTVGGPESTANVKTLEEIVAISSQSLQAAVNDWGNAVKAIRG